MDLHISQVPIWISGLFSIIFCTLPILLIANAIKQAFENAGLKSSLKIKKQIFVFYGLYFLIIAIMSLSGVFVKNTLPPRIMIIAVVPLFFFYLFYVKGRGWFKLVFKNIKLEQLIFIHVFRFVGFFFIVAYFYGALPKAFAFIGGIGDIVSAVLAIVVVVALRKKSLFAIPLVWVWNVIGLLDIISILTTAIILTKSSIENNTQGVAQFGTFPFSWIPAFAPATIIFLHILVFEKLKLIKAQ